MPWRLVVTSIPVVVVKETIMTSCFLVLKWISYYLLEYSKEPLCASFCEILRGTGCCWTLEADRRARWVEMHEICSLVVSELWKTLCHRTNSLPLYQNWVSRVKQDWIYSSFFFSVGFQTTNSYANLDIQCPKLALVIMLPYISCKLGFFFNHT